MASFRFIHCADLHIDSPLRGLEADPDAPAEQIRRATRDAFTALVSFAIEQKVDFVVAAGDLYDGDWQDWRTGQFLVSEVGRLSRAGIPFVAISGNHDAQSIITRRLSLPAPAAMLRADRPDTWHPPALPDVAVHGQGFLTGAVREDLSRGYPPPVPGSFNIGLLHSNADGRPGHENYAPSSVSRLRAHGYDYWALGHVHTRAVLSEAPWVVYPGNPQGRHINEAGPRGAMLVTVTDGRIEVPPAFVPLDTVRWAKVEVDVTGASDEEAMLAAGRQAVIDALQQADGRLLAVRLVLRGESPSYGAVVRGAAELAERLRAELRGIAGPEAVWLERLVPDVRPPRVAVSLPDTLIAAIEAPDAAAIGADAAAYVKDLLGRLPALAGELGEDHAAVRTARDAAVPEEIMARAETLLRAALEEG